MKPIYKIVLLLAMGGVALVSSAHAQEVIYRNEGLQVYSTSTSFEQLLEDRQKIAISRAPAAIRPIARVIAVRREFGMNALEAEEAARDIIVNGGTAQGLEEGGTYKVVRKVPVIDPYRENAQSELEIEFAEITIKHAQGDIAVGRLVKIDSIKEGLFVGTRAILVGDFIVSQ